MKKVVAVLFSPITMLILLIIVVADDISTRLRNKSGANRVTDQAPPKDYWR